MRPWRGVMSIRTRLVALLLALALGPMLALGGYTLYSLDTLGQQVGSKAHEALLAAQHARLQSKVSDAVVIYGRQTQALEHLVRDQARAAERALAAPGARRTPRYTSDFDAGRVPTQQMARYGKFLQDGRSEPIATSLDHSAIFLVAGASKQQHTADAARLADLTPTYARLSELGDLGVLWHYTSLASGIHSVYPGHGGYPADFDPRQRPWYLEAVEKRGPVWSIPFVDVTTRRVVSSVSQAIRSPDGRIVGVTGIDVSVPQIFNGRVPSTAAQRATPGMPRLP
jgi:sigma-B regulation protein RsbU (phosphoserine phosphatase)